MKKILILFINFLFCASISQSDALNVAENFFYHKRNPENNSFSVESVELFSVDDTNTFYVIELSPQGFILISYDDLIRPILAYSFENNFRFDNIPTNIDYIFKLYKKQILEQQEFRIDPNNEIKSQERIVKTNACLKSILFFSFLNEKNKTKPIKKVIILE